MSLVELKLMKAVALRLIVTEMCVKGMSKDSSPCRWHYWAAVWAGACDCGDNDIRNRTSSWQFPGD
jgi:hypothetical protein